MKTAISFNQESPGKCTICGSFGYGADAINPYLAFESLETMLNDKEFSNKIQSDNLNYCFVAFNNYIIINKGLVKVMSKMGI